MELVYIFLNGTQTYPITFKVPGATHHARWMSKAIYCLKIYMFQKQFNVGSKKELRGLGDVCSFISIVYVKAWFEAPCPIKAPVQDLNFLKSLISYKNINAKISNATVITFSRHLWYLTERLAAMSFFDVSISLDIKTKMINATKKDENKIDENKITLTKEELDTICSKDISDFITKRSLEFFEQLELSTDFLDIEPEHWAENDSYKSCYDFVKNIKCVNDVAERAIALIQKYNRTLTKNEEQKQFILQVVQLHRQQYPNCNKLNFIKN